MSKKFYYDYDKVLGFNATFNFLVTSRGLGKTYGGIVMAVKDFLKNGNEFIYLRRYKTEISSAAKHLFDAINLNKVFPGYNLLSEGNKFFIQKLSDDENGEKSDKLLMGHAVALSTANILKSTNFAKVRTIIYDEFLLGPGVFHYLPNEVEAFLDFYETVARMRDVRVFFLGNAITQSTPYFNYYKGRIEVDAMNKMGYDVVALGNHEFDNGVDTLATILRAAQFDVVCANYDMRGTALESIVKPYTIIRRNGLKIGVFGIGCDPKGLVADKNLQSITFNPPYPIAQQMADTLRAQGCDIVICLSHLGTFGKSSYDYNDSTMVATTRGIDAVIGGHTHQMHDNLRIANRDGYAIPVCQMGKSGVNLGKIVLNLGDKIAK